MCQLGGHGRGSGEELPSVKAGAASGVQKAHTKRGCSSPLSTSSRFPGSQAAPFQRVTLNASWSRRYVLQCFPHAALSQSPRSSEHSVVWGKSICSQT